MRAIARDAALPTHAKKDSTGICFIGERDFREFLARYLPARPGEIRDPQGNVVGEHPGVFFFTLGQREGLHIGGVRGRDPAPWYVVDKDVDDNVLVVDQGSDSPHLYSSTLWSEAAHWIAGAPPAARFDCTAQTRYRQHDEACTVTVADDGTLAVRFARRQARGHARAIAGAVRRRRLPRRRGHRPHGCTDRRDAFQGVYNA